MTDLQPHKKHHDPEIKLRILCQVEHGVTIESIVKSFGVTRQTIHDWKRRYDARGLEGLEEGPRSGRPMLLSNRKIVRCVKNITASGRFVTTRLLREDIHAKHGILYSKSDIRVILARNGLTYKKLNPVHARASTNEENDSWKKENSPRIRHARAKGFTLAVYNETKSEMDSGARYRYGVLGGRIYSTYPGKKQQVGIIGAIAENCRSTYCKEKVFNSDTFISFLNRAHASIGNMVLVLDNARYHNSKKVMEYLRKHTGIILVYLPPGSPHMNYIENVWGAEKTYASQTVFYDIDAFTRYVMRYICHYKFDPSRIYKKLFSDRPKEAESCILEAKTTKGHQRACITLGSEY